MTEFKKTMPVKVRNLRERLKTEADNFRLVGDYPSLFSSSQETASGVKIGNHLLQKSGRINAHPGWQSHSFVYSSLRHNSISLAGNGVYCVR